LEHNQDITATIKQYCKENLAELSVEFLFDYIHHTIIPKMVSNAYKQTKDEMGEEEYEAAVSAIIKPFRLTCISISTVSRWLHVLGLSMRQEKKVTVLMGMRSQQQFSIKRYSVSDIYHTRQGCTAEFK
jgi:hypothetical protein